MTVVIQIGNSDDKLSQMEWAGFVSEMRSLVDTFAQSVHFFGGSEMYAPWQNACWVAETTPGTEDALREHITALRDRWRQKSAAVVFGETEFI